MVPMLGRALVNVAFNLSEIYDIKLQGRFQSQLQRGFGQSTVLLIPGI